MGRDMTTDAEIDAAIERARREPEPPYAHMVEFDFDRRLLILHIATAPFSENSRRLVLPLEDIQGLADGTPEQLEDYDLEGEGYGIDWPSLKVAFRVEGLLAGVTGNQRWMRELERRRGSVMPKNGNDGSKTPRTRRVKVPA